LQSINKKRRKEQIQNHEELNQGKEEAQRLEGKVALKEKEKAKQRLKIKEKKWLLTICKTSLKMPELVKIKRTKLNQELKKNKKQ
jgi:hypothetical protein